ncbi:hypothetical protein J6590_002930 [Homalodisca vitripennis]|nr:hypothetical protein J6590_002930 [Homalodisca vitripennis]
MSKEIKVHISKGESWCVVMSHICMEELNTMDLDRKVNESTWYTQYGAVTEEDLRKGPVLKTVCKTLTTDGTPTHNVYFCGFLENLQMEQFKKNNPRGSNRLGRRPLPEIPVLGRLMESGGGKNCNGEKTATRLPQSGRKILEG